ncbi:MAG: hypothetical protein ACPGO3_10325 [Magnetospiraceae bacterium]
MAKRKSPSEKVISAVLDIIEEDGWAAVTMAAAARRASVPLAEVRAAFSDRQAVLDAYLSGIDQAVLEATAQDEVTDESPRDRLFDVIMRRFDALAPRKAALQNLLMAATRDPAISICGSGRLATSMRWMLEAAGLCAAGPVGALKTVGMAALYASVFRVWLKDESPDMSKTMAALDKALDRAERLYKGLCKACKFKRHSATDIDQDTDDMEAAAPA